MTASGDPAACMRLAISRLPLNESWEDFCELLIPEMFDIAESIEDVRGACPAMSTRCWGAVAAIGLRVVVGEPPGAVEVRTESETLREVPLEGPYLE